MSRLRKRVRIGKYAIPIFLLATLAIGTVAAVAYVILTWSMSLTVAANPRVSFYLWPSGPLENTFTESFKIFPDVKTIQENATYGIYSLTTGTGSMRIVSDIASDTDIDEVYIKVFEKGQTPILELNSTIDGTGFKALPTGTDIYYTIWIEVNGASGASAPGSTSVDLEIKVESP